MTGKTIKIPGCKISRKGGVSGAKCQAAALVMSHQGRILDNHRYEQQRAPVAESMKTPACNTGREE
jgi:hypothetical protein